MSVAPSQYPPPVDSAKEFIGPPTDAEDERIEVGVAIVGGGQAGLACAIRLLQLLEDDPELTEKLGEVPVAVIEKGKVAGAHQLSGGVMNPNAIRELLPEDDSWPHWGEVKRESVHFMVNRKRAIKLWPVPPPGYADLACLRDEAAPCASEDGAAQEFWRCLRLADDPGDGEDWRHEARRRMKRLQPELHGQYMRRAAVRPL